MAKRNIRHYQNYPRISEGEPGAGLLDDSALVPHTLLVAPEEIFEMIKAAITRANLKSSRAILSVEGISEDRLTAIYEKAGKDLFTYFKKYSTDPAASAHQIYKRHYRDVARDQFRLQTLQKERMNSAWRYQFFVVDCARKTQRFISISDIGTKEADFHASIRFLDGSLQPLRLFVSVKNRKNTLGGQDWPKAIEALERAAQLDMNATGPYLCVFGIVMDKGERFRKIAQETGDLYSQNTEVWPSDFFWPFFTNYSYEQIMLFFLETLIQAQSDADPLLTETLIPEEVIETFGNYCYNAGLLDENGYFNDPQKLVSLFCGTLTLSKTRKLAQQVDDEDLSE